MSREVQSSIVQKSVTVINLLANHKGRLSQTEIAQATGFNKSSTHRILSILMGQELVEYDERDRTYSTGPLLISWARAAWEKMDLSLVKDQDLRDLATETGMNVALGVRIEHTVTFIRTNIPHPYRLAVKEGGQSELHNTAVGKVFLAHMTKEERDAYFKVAELEKFTETTLTKRRDIEAVLEDIRSKGFAVSDREEFYQVVGIAAPIFDHDGRILAAISLWIPLRVSSLDDLLACAPILLNKTNEVSARFGQLTG
ncbi:IclR family transcriptional regulator [uncultured Roseobacter sp.]|uniref:IclR family transcriptional regulator n=1 Tax=uncultured Roseobacter sp. TaxID=114847 RepID=UPI002632621E|nr:IclR family transcriptional regulator [uncultured Roseobacter sp.]